MKHNPITVKNNSNGELAIPKPKSEEKYFELAISQFLNNEVIPRV
jgi:hypothetical protein